jgi:hypothetical protein
MKREYLHIREVLGLMPTPNQRGLLLALTFVSDAPGGGRFVPVSIEWDEVMAWSERFGTARAADPLLQQLGVAFLSTNEDTGQVYYVVTRASASFWINHLGGRPR